MTERDLRRLKRNDLLHILALQARQIEAFRVDAEDAASNLRKENQELRRQLELAESKPEPAVDTAVDFDGMLEAAHKATEAYLENIWMRSADQDSILAAMNAKSQARIDQMVADTELECASRRAATEQECALQQAMTEKLCQKITAEAIRKIDAYWTALTGSLDSIYASHAELHPVHKETALLN